MFPLMSIGPPEGFFLPAHMHPETRVISFLPISSPCCGVLAVGLLLFWKGLYTNVRPAGLFASQSAASQHVATAQCDMH